MISNRLSAELAPLLDALPHHLPIQDGWVEERTPQARGGEGWEWVVLYGPGGATCSWPARVGAPKEVPADWRLRECDDGVDAVMIPNCTYDPGCVPWDQPARVRLYTGALVPVLSAEELADCAVAQCDDPQGGVESVLDTPAGAAEVRSRIGRRV